MPSQPSSINVIKISNPKGNKQPNGKKKVCGKKINQDGKGNINKLNSDVREGKKESKKKFKFPWKLATVTIWLIISQIFMMLNVF